MAKKYEISEEEPSANKKGLGLDSRPQMVSEPPVGEACVAIERPVLHPVDVVNMNVASLEEVGLTHEQLAKILALCENDKKHNRVYSHAEVMERLRNYEYGHSLV